jgi:hypothetical protein
MTDLGTMEDRSSRARRSPIPARDRPGFELHGLHAGSPKPRWPGCKAWVRARRSGPDGSWSFAGSTLEPLVPRDRDSRFARRSAGVADREPVRAEAHGLGRPGVQPGVAGHRPRVTAIERRTTRGPNRDGWGIKPSEIGDQGLRDPRSCPESAGHPIYDGGPLGCAPRRGSRSGEGGPQRSSNASRGPCVTSEGAPSTKSRGRAAVRWRRSSAVSRRPAKVLAVAEHPGLETRRPAASLDGRA